VYLETVCIDFEYLYSLFLRLFFAVLLLVFDRRSLKVDRIYRLLRVTQRRLDLFIPGFAILSIDGIDRFLLCFTLIFL